jgi:integrase
VTLIEKTRRGKPLFRVRWNYRDRGIDGKPYDERDFTSKTAARAWDKKVSADPASATATLTIRQVCEMFLAGPIAEGPSSTYDDYEGVFRLHVYPGIGKKRADRLTPIEASQWRTKLSTTGFASLGPERAPGDKRPRAKRPARPVKAPTAGKVIRIVRSAMRWARGEGYTSCRVFEDLRPPKDRRPHAERRSEPYAYDSDEMDAIVAACETLMEKTIVLLAKDSGLRRSELFALCWDKVDLDDGYVHVHRAFDKDGSFKDPKTYEVRSVAVLEDGLAALRDWADVARPAGDLAQLVFRNEDGSSLHTNWDSGYAGQRKKDARGDEYVSDGIRSRSGIWLRLHELRDTFVFTIIMSGASDMEVTVTVGHQSLETTRKHYFRFLKVAQEDLRIRANRQMRNMRELVKQARTTA